MTHRHLVLVDESLSDRLVPGTTTTTTTTVGEQLRSAKRARVKVVRVSTLRDMRRACDRRRAGQCADADADEKWETISVLLDGASSVDPTRVTILRNDLCVDVDSREYHTGRVYHNVRKTMERLRRSVAPPDDHAKHRGVYFYALAFGRSRGVQQLFCSERDASAVPVFLSTSRAEPNTLGSVDLDWDIEWGSHCWHRPRPSQRKHAERRLFHDIAQLTLRLDGANDHALDDIARDEARRARVALESYIDLLERALNDRSLRFDDASKATLGELIRRTSSWIDANADAEKSVGRKARRVGGHRRPDPPGREPMTGEVRMTLFENTILWLPNEDFGTSKNIRASLFVSTFHTPCYSIWAKCDTNYLQKDLSEYFSTFQNLRLGSINF